MAEINEKAKEIADLLKLIANENRLLILCELSKEPQTVSTLLKKLNITQSGLSQHLALLKANGILDYDKKAQKITYNVKDDRILALLATIKETTSYKRRYHLDDTAFYSFKT